ncbi:lysophospholipase L1-like esterase [Lipingzhangella halophila]|uniref:Lysophospholipase L1-like esterase n=1 Tax=Lipingzhangella halophila TaxID=1783352 RepID=A0A7W7W2P0_9ACTN|nr:GDSL-type esterase/lipase family protein [Lipingzhangella halophila]MBB4932142.1 lysophospholipase L1-like esterase [Lipingzhangella halophila]
MSRRRLLLVLTVPLLAAALVAATSGYLTFVRAPANNPDEFLSNGPRPQTDTVVVAAGSSSTHASASGDYVRMLRESLGDQGYEFVNAGSNGATSTDVLDSLDEIVEIDPDVVTILIGGNDVRDFGGAAGVGKYRKNMTRILDRLDAETSAEVALISPQPSGEDPENPNNRALAQYIDVLTDLADTRDATYIPLNEELADLIAAEGRPPRPDGFSFGAAYASGFRHHILRQSWDEIAEDNGYAVYTDGLHLSDTGARTAADLVADWLSERER